MNEQFQSGRNHWRLPDDRLILGLSFFLTVVATTLVFMIRLTKEISLRIFLLLIAVLCLLDLFYQWKSGNLTDIHNHEQWRKYQ